FFCSSRRRHTRSKRDWSSDVCSSDLGMGISVHAVAAAPWLLVAGVASMLILRGGGVWLSETWLRLSPGLTTTRDRARVGLYAAKIGRASCRERGESGVEGGAGEKQRE